MTTISDERLAEIVGAGVPCFPIEPWEVPHIVQELRSLRSKPVAGVDLKPLDRRATTSPAGDLAATLEALLAEHDADRADEAVNAVEQGERPDLWKDEITIATHLIREAAQTLRHQSTGVTGVTDEMVEAFLATPVPNRFASMRGVVTRGFLEADSNTPLDEARSHVRKGLTAALSAQERG